MLTEDCILRVFEDKVDFEEKSIGDRGNYVMRDFVFYCSLILFVELN